MIRNRAGSFAKSKLMPPRVERDRTHHFEDGLEPSIAHLTAAPTYDSVVVFGQRRARLVWQRIIRPDGASGMIDDLQATDTTSAGRNGP
jgi:hypothetical protein